MKNKDQQRDRDYKPSQFEESHGMNWNICPQHSMIIPVIYPIVANDDREGCICKNLPDFSMSREFQSSGNVTEARDAWFKLWESNKPGGKETGGDGLRRAQKDFREKNINKEWFLWIVLWETIWPVVLKRRAQIRQKKRDPMEEVKFDEEDAELLMIHQEDISARESHLNQTIPLDYCTQHYCWGDALPTRNPSRYKDCGICVEQMQETPERIQRAKEDMKKKIPQAELKFPENNNFIKNDKKRSSAYSDTIKEAQEEEEDVEMKS